MRRLRKSNGQSTLEYLIILMGIIAALAAARGIIQGHVQSALNTAGSKLAAEVGGL